MRLTDAHLAVVALGVARRAAMVNDVPLIGARHLQHPCRALLGAASAGTDKWHIVYCRRPQSDTKGNYRQVCVGETHFDQAGMTPPVKITNKRVAAQPLRQASFQSIIAHF